MKGLPLIIFILGYVDLHVSGVTTPTRSWDFRGCSSSTVDDSISGGLVATISGYGGTAVCSTDGVTMNGDTAAYISIASWYWDGTSGVSFEVFAKVTTLGYYYRFFDFGNSNPWDNTVHFSGYDTTHEIILDVYPDSSSETTLVTSPLVVLDEWIHLVATIDSTGNYKVYKDGIVNSTRTGGSVPAAATRASNYIGKSNFYPSDKQFIGTFGYLQMWEGTVLSATDIEELYSAVAPSSIPTLAPTLSPSFRPTPLPTTPSPQPTVLPSPLPTMQPSPLPTPQPTIQPSPLPTMRPSPLPTTRPTLLPSPTPTLPPSPLPTAQPTIHPSPLPTLQPSPLPTTQPTVLPSPVPTLQPSPVPTTQPTIHPSPLPTSQPSPLPTTQPTVLPSPIPTLQPSPVPTAQPTIHPSPLPTMQPSPLPTAQPTPFPSMIPSPPPSFQPTPTPTASPSLIPLSQPTSAPTLFCGPGTFLDDDTLACESCAIGRYTDTATPPWPSNCTLCPAGTYSSSVASDSCTACSTGKLSSEDRSVCKDCSAGEYSYNDAECVACEYGKYAPSAQTGSCLSCAAGFYTNNASGATLCSSCDAGKFSSALTAVSCSSCSEGSYSGGGAETCTPCAVGTFTASNASSSCDKCPSGQFAANTSSSTCIECTLGKAQPASGQSSCTSCDSGYYAGEEGLSSCSQCAAGFAVADTGARECSACLEGTFQSRTGSSICEECVAGKYADTNGSLSCTDCSNELNSESGSSVCNLAAEGYYLKYNTLGLIISVSCPENAKCSGDDVMPRPVKGYWVDRSSFAFAGDVYFCPRDTCTGAVSSTSDETCWNSTSYNEQSCDSDMLQCEDGSGSTLCGSCDDGYTFNSATQRCIACDSGGSYLPFLIGLGLLFLFFIGAAMMKFKFHNDRGSHSGWLQTHFTGSSFPSISSSSSWHFDTASSSSLVQQAKKSSLLALYLFPRMVKVIGNIDRGALKVMWSCYQIIGTVSWNLSIVFPPPFNKLIFGLGFLQLDALTLDCVTGKSNFKKSVLASSAFPLLLGLLNALVYFLRITAQGSRKVVARLSVVQQRVSSGLLRSSLSTNMLRHQQQIIREQDQEGEDQDEDQVRSNSNLGASCISQVELEHGLNQPLQLPPLQVEVARAANEQAKEELLQQEMKEKANYPIFYQHALIFLLLSYHFLPPVSMIQFEGLNCIHLKHGSSFLRSDTSINCHSNSYLNFRFLLIILIIIYQSIPLIWFVLLFQRRNELNPKLTNKIPTIELVLIERLKNKHLDWLKFLWEDYIPNQWYFEVLYMYWRILFIAVIPLLGSGSLRASIACFVSILSIAFSREICPFTLPTTNILLVVAQYQILFTFMAALILIANSLDVFGLSDFGLGAVLLSLNSLLILLTIYWAFLRQRIEDVKSKWRHPLNTAELDAMEQIFNQNKQHHEGTTIGEDEEKKRTQNILDNHKLNVEDVVLVKRVGAGSFGEVFQGIWSGDAVAVKTMLHVSEENLKAFKAEILLLATLRHPNIVNFVGACWEKELICMVLEWVPKGTLSDSLNQNFNSMTWEDPLLNFAVNITRGMIYLHDRSYIDSIDGKHKKCILHRDLKPENVLISEFLRAKINDFGTSRFKSSSENVIMTFVGTPFYCAPEIMRGEKYDESCDVYSFGMLLLDMATQENVLTFVAERWCQHFKKKKAPKQPMRIIRYMIEDGWRPVVGYDEYLTMGPKQTISGGGGGKGGGNHVDVEYQNSHSRDPLEYFGNILPGVPISICELFVRCCHHNPKLRPKFTEILDMLNGTCTLEIESGKFNRPSSIITHLANRVSLFSIDDLIEESDQNDDQNNDQDDDTIKEKKKKKNLYKEENGVKRPSDLYKSSQLSSSSGGSGESDKLQKRQRNSRQKSSSEMISVTSSSSKSSDFTNFSSVSYNPSDMVTIASSFNSSNLSNQTSNTLFFSQNEIVSVDQPEVQKESDII